MCSTVICPAALSAGLVVWLQVAPPSAAGQWAPSQQSVRVSAWHVAALFTDCHATQLQHGLAAAALLVLPRLLCQPLQAVHVATLRRRSCHLPVVPIVSTSHLPPLQCQTQILAAHLRDAITS